MSLESALAGIGTALAGAVVGGFGGEKNGELFTSSVAGLTGEIDPGFAGQAFGRSPPGNNPVGEVPGELELGVMGHYRLIPDLQAAKGQAVTMVERDGGEQVAYFYIDSGDRKLRVRALR